MEQHITFNFTTIAYSKKGKRDIITSLISSFIGLVYEGISSFLFNRRHKALHKAVKVMKSKVDIQHNKLLHLEDTMVMYGIYNAEISEKLIKTAHQMNNTTTPNEKLFTGELSTAITQMLVKMEFITMP